MEGLGFYGGIYVGVMGGIIFSAVVFIICVASTRALRQKEDALGLKSSGIKFKCPSMKVMVSEEACRFHRAMAPEDCVNCLIPKGEAA